METPREPDHRSLGPPPDSDLIGIPLVVGLVVAVAVILLSFFFLDWVGFLVLGIVLIAALAISYRVISDSEARE